MADSWVQKDQDDFLPIINGVLLECHCEPLTGWSLCREMVGMQLVVLKEASSL